MSERWVSANAGPITQSNLDNNEFALASQSIFLHISIKPSLHNLYEV